MFKTKYYPSLTQKKYHSLVTNVIINFIMTCDESKPAILHYLECAGKSSLFLLSSYSNYQSPKRSSPQTMAATGRSIRVLNVAEKPSVAKSVSSILSRNQGLRVRDGRSRYNRIFEFNYTINGQSCEMLFTSVTGHLMELDFDERFRKWHSCNPADLFHAPVQKFVPEVHLFVFLCNMYVLV